MAGELDQVSFVTREDAQSLVLKVIAHQCSPLVLTTITFLLFAANWSGVLSEAMKNIAWNKKWAPIKTSRYPISLEVVVEKICVFFGT